MIARIIGALLEGIYEQRITDSSVLPLILSRDEERIENLQVIDCMYQSVLTSLQFGQYRRAVWYLQAFSLICDKIFTDSNQKRIIQTLHKRIHITGSFQDL